ncbi:hypothetical protein LOZ12_004791 [Ophidiomyces ophidiicola]|uniref:Uncharacterized protein n=1 Tax=Ophidiomyces ophidiicola TaxID=1387563 RepID=A0ACB8UW48_9EURO|nr:hypothetical protein LOZ62_003571 [Ophidiomyces ophidiicola]KAI1955976.1 hypothetical protein LOZ59_004358 [Ophidiomyces ophidiicola]KAI1971443.1 hypothetical protein LOZ56_003012 [Ophidiomyces ophidiicola]KAI2005616.1 hypothetical protein LOZ50_003554 [Ophidiomyces ophidiicola]KAI2023525.1 hypothetical protein LOZ45_003939 [Ophidiomyces ophidiicola]
MGVSLPDELIISISQQLPCRDLQIKQLATLLCPSLPTIPALFIHGPHASGKSSVIRRILAEYTTQNEHDAQQNPSPKIDSKKRKRRGKGDVNDPSEHLAAKAFILSSVVRVAECITARHFLVNIVSSAILAVQNAGAQIHIQGSEAEWRKIVDKIRCEHVSSLPAAFRDILSKTKCERYVLVLDGVDELREGGQMLLAALARLGELIPPLCVVFVSRSTPRPMSLQIAEIPHVYFPPYSRIEILSILSSLPSPPADGLSEEAAAKLYPSFLSTLYDSLIGPIDGTVPVFRSACKKIWPLFVAPIVNQEKPPGGEWDFSRLIVKNRALFQQQGERLLLHRIAPDTSIPSTTNGTIHLTKKPARQLPALSYLPTLILTAAFLAAYIPQRLDTIFFSKFTASKKKRIRRRRGFKAASQDQSQGYDLDDPTNTPSKTGKKSGAPSRIKKTNGLPSSTSLGSRTGLTNFLTPRPFPLERLLAIYHAIDPNRPLNSVPPAADTLAPNIATLQRLRLLIPASSAAAASGSAIDGGEKWCLNLNVTVSSSSSVNEEWIVEMARSIGVDIDEYLAIT